MKIKVMTVGDLAKGYGVAEVDDDAFPVDTFVPADAYDPTEQDWHRVVHMRGPVDRPSLTLAMYNGETYVAPWQASATVWVLTDDEGEPIVTDDDD